MATKREQLKAQSVLRSVSCGEDISRLLLSNPVFSLIPKWGLEMRLRTELGFGGEVERQRVCADTCGSSATWDRGSKGIAQSRFALVRDACVLFPPAPPERQHGEQREEGGEHEAEIEGMGAVGECAEEFLRLRGEDPCGDAG